MNPRTAAYLDEAAARRVTVSTFLGSLGTDDFEAYWRARRPLELELRRLLKGGAVATVRSAGGRVAWVRVTDLRPGDTVLHRHRRAFTSAPRSGKLKLAGNGAPPEGKPA